MQEVLHFLIKYMTAAVVSSNWIVKIRVWHGRNIIQNPICRKRQFGNISHLMSTCCQMGQSHCLYQTEQSSISLAPKLPFIWHRGKAVHGASLPENWNHFPARPDTHQCQHKRDNWSTWIKEGSRGGKTELSSFCSIWFSLAEYLL